MSSDKDMYARMDAAVDDYYHTVLPEPIISQVSSSPTDGIYWECPVCGKQGMVRDQSQEERAYKNGWEHIKAWHPTDEQRAEANAVKGEERTAQP